MSNGNTTILGLGLATLITTTAEPAIKILNVEGVKVGGILFQAGPNNASSLIEWGNSTNPGDPKNPGIAYDLFTRVGGDNDASKTNMTA